ncbi:MAG TPA: hypothetical protein PLR78_18020, partial [Polaromonas sp.]|uniref:hypothetical protein n=1 Tax=Polaromonas sp. TaxID=1869339 RepID=UPI002C0A077E
SAGLLIRRSLVRAQVEEPSNVKPKGPNALHSGLFAFRIADAQKSKHDGHLFHRARPTCLFAECCGYGR